MQTALLRTVPLSSNQQSRYLPTNIQQTTAVISTSSSTQSQNATKQGINLIKLVMFLLRNFVQKTNFIITHDKASEILCAEQVFKCLINVLCCFRRRCGGGLRRRIFFYVCAFLLVRMRISRTFRKHYKCRPC